MSTPTLEHAFPESLRDSVDAVAQRLPTASFPPSIESIGPVSVDGASLMIPRRVYNAPAAPPGALDANARLVWHAVYSRHHDGFVRQRHLTPLLDALDLRWVAPYVVQLIGEYVVEIAEQIEVADIGKHSAVVDFARENPAFMQLTRQRAISYWDCYYRHDLVRGWWHYTQYPGIRTLDGLSRTGR